MLKMRLTLLVALSGVFGYAMAADGMASWVNLGWVFLGGFLVTGASNVLNQISEKPLDALMNRTSNRPLPTGVLNELEAILYAIVLCVLGVGILGYFFNLPAALLGIIALLSYAFVYTPMKRISPLCVFIGAIPGSLPPLIGWVAFTGSLDTGGWILFAFQFFWQFPHFWAIAWLLDEDYQKAGFKMLPTSSGKSRTSARLILTYTLCLVPLVYFAWNIGLVNGLGSILLVVLGLAFAFPAWKLFQNLEATTAKRLMFASFLYLPLIQLVFIFA